MKLYFVNDMLYRSFLKRLIDIIFSLILLIFLSPLATVIILLVKLDGGSIFFSDVRLGMGNKRIKVFKFRTMKVNANLILDDLLSKNPKLYKQWHDHYKLEPDPRVTRLGKVLRKTKIDEIPQLLNVLIGNMSLVGPRPLSEVEFNNKFNKKSKDIYLSVMPGITGAWQVYGSDTYEKRIEMELKYIEKFGFFEDIKIMLLTVYVIIRGKKYG